MPDKQGLKLGGTGGSAPQLLAEPPQLRESGVVDLGRG